MTDEKLEKEVFAFLRDQRELEQTCQDKPWVVFADEQFRGAFDTYFAALNFAVQSYGSGNFLIRSLSQPEPHVPMLVADSR